MFGLPHITQLRHLSWLLQDFFDDLFCRRFAYAELVSDRDLLYWKIRCIFCGDTHIAHYAHYHKNKKVVFVSCNGHRYVKVHLSDDQNRTLAVLAGRRLIG